MTATSPAFIGNTRARHLLDVAIQGERAHAILLTGPAGLGKRTLARLALAQAAGRPVQAADPDVLDLSRDPGALGGPGGIGREVAVRIVKHLSRRPVASPRSCVLLPGADRLTPEAANALLVTLEEPPAHALILLTATNAGAVLPTVRSRCLPIPLQLVSAAEIKAGLGAPNPVVALAAGRPGRALRYLHDPAFAQQLDALRRDVQAWQAGDVPSRLQLAARYGAEREATSAFLGEVDLALPLSWRRGLLDARRRLARNVQPRAVLEAFAMLQV